jgi:chromosome segregation ATPase
VGIIRDKREQTLTLTLPERSQSDVFDESFEIPDVKAEIDIDQVNKQVEELKPRLEFAEREMKRVQPEIEKATRELCQEQSRMKRDMEQIQRDMQREQERIQEELRNEMHAASTEI